MIFHVDKISFVNEKLALIVDWIFVSGDWTANDFWNGKNGSEKWTFVTNCYSGGEWKIWFFEMENLNGDDVEKKEKKNGSTFQ